MARAQVVAARLKPRADPRREGSCTESTTPLAAGPPRRSSAAAEPACTAVCRHRSAAHGCPHRADGGASMNAILSIVLALAGFTDPPAASPPGSATQTAPAVAGVCGDCVDLALLLEDPCVDTSIVDVWMDGDLAVVTAVHSFDQGGSSDC